MKKLLKAFLLLVLLFAPILQYGQSINYTKNWYMGWLVGLNFNGGAPVFAAGGQIVSIEGNATASDASGNLLFYTNGTSVWNRNHTVMPNGTGLMGGSSALQAALIVPDPGNTNQYYVFTTHHIASTGLRWSKVDMTLNGGLGDIVASSKNTLLFQPTTERQTAVVHANGTDIWVLGQQMSSNTLRAYRVTTTGISTGPTSTLGATPGNGIGQMKFSPNGQNMVWSDHGGGSAHLYDFDANTGVVSNYSVLASGMTKAAGCSFSPDNSKIYVTMGTNYKDVYQFDACAGDRVAIAASMTLVGSYAGSWGGGLQIGPDGKIYFAHYTSNYMGVINSPNTLGVACNYVDNGSVSLGGGSIRLGTPTFVESVFLAAPGGTLNGCTVLASGITELDAKATATRKVLVQWNAIEDANARHYEIERSFDGLNFERIGTEDVQDGEGDFHKYTFLDHGPGTGINYYRLNLLDFNGLQELSTVVEVEFEGPTAGWTAFPVPANNSFTLARALPEIGGFGQLTLVNEIGQTVWEYQTSSEETQVQVNSMDLSSGLYHLRYMEGDLQSTMPIIIR